MFAEILTVVPLILPPVPPTGTNYERYLGSPNVAQVVTSIAMAKPVPASAALDLPNFLTTPASRGAIDYSRYNNALSLQLLVFVTTVQAGVDVRQPVPPRHLPPAFHQLPPGGFTLTDVTNDLTWRRETAGRLRGIFE